MHCDVGSAHSEAAGQWGAAQTRQSRSLDRDAYSVYKCRLTAALPRLSLAAETKMRCTARERHTSRANEQRSALLVLHGYVLSLQVQTEAALPRLSPLVQTATQCQEVSV